MAFKTMAVKVSGDVYHLRELSAGAIECVDDAQSEYVQALTMVALSLCDDNGLPMFKPRPDAVDAALDMVRKMPVSLVRDYLIPAATTLNTEGGSLDDARGN